MSNSQSSSSLVGSVFERNTSKAAVPPTFSASKTGFPTVQHRSLGKGRSAFSKSREAQKKHSNEILTRSQQAPPIVPSNTSVQSPEDDWRAQMSRENELRVQSMTKEEREREKQEIFERFGAGVGEILRRAREARERKEKASISLEEVPVTSEPVERHSSSPTGSPPPSSLSTASTRPNSPSRASRKLRFAELTADNVHVYESAPPSPRRKILALPPPDDNASDAISLGTYKGISIPHNKINDEKLDSVPRREETENTAMAEADKADLDEGTPEFIRRRYFPDAPLDNPDLAWMLNPSPSSVPTSLDLRFDLNGLPIPASKSLSLPAHLGLHHHAEGTHAGYTLDDIFLLSRSSVKAQRAAMLTLLKGLAKWWKHDAAQSSDEEICAAVEQMRQSSPESPPLLKRILFVGLEALPERGVVGVRAMEVVWECLVGKAELEDDFEFIYLGGIERAETLSDTSFLYELPWTDVMPQFIRILSSPPDDVTDTTSVPGTPTQHLVLSVLHHLAKYSNSMADQACSSNASGLGLVITVIKTFIYTPNAIAGVHSTPNSHAIRLLTTLAMASRTNAKILCEYGDMFLRFVVTALSALQGSDLSPALYSQIQSALVETLYLYASLARYGMYAHIATDAQEVWWKLGDYVESLANAASAPETIVCSRENSRLIAAWANLLEAWIICATDPHQMTPPHDFLWSQVVGWEWGKRLLALAEKLAQNNQDVPEERDDSPWTRNSRHAKTAVWRALAAWLEGAKINGIRGGEQERNACAEVLQKLFGQEDRQEGFTIEQVTETLKEGLSNLTEGECTQADNARTCSRVRHLSHQSYVLMSALRLWLACCPPSSAGPMTSPPFELPFARISEVCARLTGHSVWSLLSSFTADKSISENLPYIRLLCRPFSSLLVFYLQLCHKLPEASEDLWLAQAFSIILTLQCGDEENALMILKQILAMITSDWAGSRGFNIAAVWQKDGMEVIRPFLSYDISPDSESYISPLCPSPRSLSMSTSLRLPSRAIASKRGWKPSGLPLRKGWALSPVDHVLRSGSEHSLFSQKGLLPSEWDATETEIVRSSLLFTLVGREVVHRFAGNMLRVLMTREETIFGCMKVFMLEHGQDQNEIAQEVFRDNIVNKLMEDLINPYTVALSHSSSQADPSTTGNELEQIAAEFLGSSTPFYQFYTDFVALYDAISFSNPLFSRLLFPPTSMRYPVDYRKHLWNDFSHVVKGIQIPIDQVISSDIREYLWPVEDDPQMIGAYLRVLIKHGSSLSGFVRLVAIHHVACNIWQDLLLEDKDEPPPGAEDRASRLLKAVVGQGGTDVVREVTRYRQAKKSLSLPPACFSEIRGFKEERVRSVRRWGGEGMLQRIELLFNE